MTIHKSMLEIAAEILKRKRNPQKFDKIFKEVVAELGLSEEESEKRFADFYNDLSLSGIFVYTGDNEWDLKERQSVDLWEKDASFFIDPEELKARKAERQAEKARLKAAIEEAQKAAEKPVEEEPEEEITFVASAEDLIPKEENEDAQPEEEVVVEEPIEDNEMIDEEDYNKYMDEYEDLYEDD